MAAARAAKQALLHAILFAPPPSFPGAEFGLAAPVILPQEPSHLQPFSCRSAALTNTFDLAAAFGGPAPAPMPAPIPRRDVVPPGLASLLQAAEMAQSARTSSRIDTQLHPQQHIPQFANGGVLGSSSFTWLNSDYSSSAPTSNVVLPVGVPNFLAFLQESGSTLSLNAMAPFSCNQTAALQQLVLLQHWLPILDRMAPVHKNLLWETCKMFPTFRLTIPRLTSFRKMVTAWAANIAVYMPNITALFAAIGYLKHHDILKSEFYFPDTQQPVFRAFVPSAPLPATTAMAPAPMCNPLKRPSVAIQPPALSTCAPPSPPAAAPLSPLLQGDRGRDRSPDLEETPRPQAVKRSRVMTIASLTDSNPGAN